MNNDILKTLYSEEDIENACKRLGEQITKDYQGENPIVIGVLKGAIFFMTDIVRDIDLYMDIDFIDVSSYHGGTQSSGSIELMKDVDIDVNGRNVLFIEDIIDTGRTLKYLEDLLSDRGAKSIKVCTLMDKPEGRVVEAKADYVGLEVPNEFVVGYGLDYNGKYRNLPYVGVLKPKVYSNK
ncbi:hypoxanthine phosphoribosyltransferase [Apilactobacillus timberlakei]|uniref:Hypoxanthine phosphoribosyltransferase n=1 Tax=Apilactobacillus timberlakei TaxID=2008380 RepID=A0ABY2YRZ5_9LACO|nr:hypoxanthine phosphoribosyltransferase [Apilactobacillus timberlakei]TPR12200.1 hypoxanthine phosphoribosyltransferase [Apilactobacillus timberlakei]TPR12480.1 hypoxanthine phosphoribosyltransferase [Apilactobacillus timberlakei]TPR13600.1 hypoxanthine phosphoribosyltransferase [Apilactobacillus timberlakei]TPR16337.1 hypoxanthine phosphoribosyltransferase [Apilactobacillus timberlakei]TPR17587.1 hypoxanthine phosphoribosyltransferase [Apilactobacillus timberlakei]